MGVIDDLIAQARAEVAEPETIPVPVVVKGGLVELVFTKLLGADWLGLTATNPPRAGAVLDSNLGFNIDAVGGAYPADKVTIAGEAPTKEQWAEFYGLLAGPHRKNIATAIWGMNQFAIEKELGDLGKVSRAGSRKKRS